VETNQLVSMGLYRLPLSSTTGHRVQIESESLPRITRQVTVRL
jgi:hypothetical protein